jgi:hypothetical protein
MMRLTADRVVEQRPQPTGKTSRIARMTGIRYRSSVLCAASNSHRTSQRRAASLVDKESMDAILNPHNNENGLAASRARSSGITSLSGLSTKLFSSACARSRAAHTTSHGRMPLAPSRGGKNLTHLHSQAKHLTGVCAARRGNLSSTIRTTHTSCTLRFRRCSSSFR